MRNDAATTRPDELLAFIDRHDARCPDCDHALRGIARPACPECGLPLELAVSARRRVPLPWLLAFATCVATASYLPFSFAFLSYGAGSWWWDNLLPMAPAGFLVVAAGLLAIPRAFARRRCAVQWGISAALLVLASAFWYEFWFMRFM